MKRLVKAGRDLLGMTQADLCAVAGVPLITLRRIEGRPDHAGLVSDEAVAKVVGALEERGIQFLDGGAIASGPGVALKNG